MYMDNLTNKEPGIKDSTVQDSVSKEQKKKENRPSAASDVYKRQEQMIY